MAANILLRMLLCCVLLLVSGVSRARDATAVESLLRADYSSVIIDGVRNQLRKHLDSGTLSPEKIRRIRSRRRFYMPTQMEISYVINCPLI